MGAHAQYGGLLVSMLQLSHFFWVSKTIVCFFESLRRNVKCTSLHQFEPLYTWWFLRLFQIADRLHVNIDARIHRKYHCDEAQCWSSDFGKQVNHVSWICSSACKSHVKSCFFAGSTAFPPSCFFSSLSSHLGILNFGSGKRAGLRVKILGVFHIVYGCFLAIQMYTVHAAAIASRFERFFSAICTVYI